MFFKDESELINDKDLLKKYNSYKYRADSKNLKFEISIPEFHFMVTNACFSCGKEYDGDKYLGVDRLDNSEGYTVTNSRTCCWECNRAKSDMSMMEYAEFLSRFSPEKSEHIKYLKENLDLCKESGIPLFPLARLNKQNNERFTLKRDDFKPVFSVILELDQGGITVYRKMFCMFNNYYEYMDSVGGTDESLPVELLARLRKDYKQFIKGKLKKGCNIDGYETRSYRNSLNYDKISSNMMSRLLARTEVLRRGDTRGMYVIDLKKDT